MNIEIETANHIGDVVGQGADVDVVQGGDGDSKCGPRLDPSRQR